MYWTGLLRARCERPYRRHATQRRYEFSSLDVDCHATLAPGRAHAMEGMISRFDCVVCGRSAYPPRLFVNADITALTLSARSGLGSAGSGRLVMAPAGNGEIGLCAGERVP